VGRNFFNQAKLSHHLKVNACFKKSKKNIVKRPRRRPRRSLSAKLAGYLSSSDDHETTADEKETGEKVSNVVERPKRSATANNDSETSSDEVMKGSNKKNKLSDEISSPDCSQRSAA